MRRFVSFLSLSTARTALWNYASKVPIGTATAGEKSAVDSIISLAADRLLTAVNFRGAIVTARLRVWDEQITLPSGLDGIRSLRLVNDDGTLGRSYQVYSQQVNFAIGSCFPDCAVDDGTGMWSSGGSSADGIKDLGEGFPLFRDPEGEFYIRCKTDLTEAGTTILIRGLDENGEQVYSGAGVEGCSLAVTTADTTTTQKFTQISSWIKAAATTGTIRLYSVDTTTAEETHLVNITPAKLTSGYRRYEAAGFSFGATVEALCNIALIAPVVDNDPVLPSNLGALKLAMMALQYEDKNDMERADSFMARGVDLLEKDRDSFDGDEVSTVPFVGFHHETTGFCG